MRIYRGSTIVSAICTLIALFFSLVFMGASTPLNVWIENMFIGVFASALLMFFSSIIGYIKEEQRSSKEYLFRLMELKEKVINLETIPLEKTDINEIYTATVEIHNVLINYFYLVDTNFLIPQRKIPRYILNMQMELREFMDETRNALTHICVKRTNKKYMYDDFRADIARFIEMVDNFNASGKKMGIWLELKEKEYASLLKKE